MPSKKTAKKSNAALNKAAREQSGPWYRIFLTLSLVPMIIGVLLIVAWALDIDLFNSFPNQIVTGTLFLLFSFAASNAIQRKWQLAAGWFLIMIADWVILTQMILWVQIAAGVIGLAGVALIGYEFFRRIAAQNPARKA